VSCYRIVSYTDGDIGACETCATGTVNTWGGDFTGNTELDPCMWYPTTPADQINGHVLDGTGSYLGLGTGVWESFIYCFDSLGLQVLIWSGTKSTGATPVGTYTRTGGCDDTAELVIEECPS